MVNAKKKRGLRERLGDRVFYGVCMAMITLMGVACLYPYLNLVAKSLSGSAVVSAGRVLGVWPIDFTLSSYAYVLHSARFTRAIGWRGGFWWPSARIPCTKTSTVICCGTCWTRCRS